IASIADSRDQVTRALGIVAAREKARIIGHPGFAIYQGNASALVHFQFQFIGLQPGRIAILTESRDNRIGFDHKLATWNGYRATAATGVRIAELVANKLQATYMHSIVAQDLERRDKILEFHMLYHGLIDFVLVRPHLFL